jgi:hypothetical protein
MWKSPQIVIGLFCLYIWLGPVGRWCFKEWKKWRIKQWAIAKGVVTKTDIVCAPDIDPKRGSTAWIAVLCYSYEVNGIEYQGSLATEPWYVDVRSALAGADDLIGKNIQIRYRPDVPAKSTWLESDGGSGQLAAPAKPDPVSGLVILSLK